MSRPLERTASVNSALSAEARRRALSPPPPYAGGGLKRRHVPAPARSGAFDDGRITQQTRSRETRTVRSMMTRKPLFQHPPERLRQIEATEEACDWHQYDPTWGAEERQLQADDERDVRARLAGKEALAQSSLKVLSFYAPIRSQKNLWDRKKKLERRSTQHVLRGKAKEAARHEKFLAWMNEAGSLVPEREELRLPWITSRRGPAMSPSVLAMPAYRRAAAADGVGSPAVRKSLPADLSRYREHLEMSENEAGLFLEGSPVVDVANILSAVDARAEEESRARDRKNVGMDTAAWHVAQEALAARGMEMDSEGKIFYTDKFTGWRVYLLRQQRTAKREELTCQESVPTLQTTSRPLSNKHHQVFLRVRETLERKRECLADNLKNLAKLKEDARVRASELAADYRRGYEKQIQQQTSRLDHEIHQTHQQLRQRSMEIAAVDSTWRHQTPLAPSRTRASCHVGPNSPIDDDAAMQKGVTLARSSGRCAAGVGSSHLPEVEALPQSADQDARQSLAPHHVRELPSLSEGINSVVGRWKQTGWQVFEETEWRAVEEQERDGASPAGGKLPKGWTPVLDSPSLPR